MNGNDFCDNNFPTTMIFGQIPVTRITLCIFSYLLYVVVGCIITLNWNKSNLGKHQSMFHRELWYPPWLISVLNDQSMSYDFIIDIISSLIGCCLNMQTLSVHLLSCQQNQNKTNIKHRWLCTSYWSKVFYPRVFYPQVFYLRVSLSKGFFI